MRISGSRVLIVVSLVFVMLISSSSSRAEGTVIAGVNIVAGVYQPTTARASDGRTAVQLLKGMHTNYVMRGFFKWGPSPPAQYIVLKSSVAQLKAAIPSLIYGGGIAAQYLVRQDTWANGGKISDPDFQKMLARDASGNPIAAYDGFLPDLASSAYRDYLIGWSKKQVDAGVGAIFFDGVYVYAQYKTQYMGKRWTDTMTEYGGYFASVTANVKAYAASKGRQLFITMNNQRAVDIATWPAASVTMEDFVSVTFSAADFQAPFSLTEDWAKIKSAITSKFGHEVLIVAFIDWSSNEDTAMHRFGTLSTANQINLIRQLDSATRSAGILFAYPVYGGNVDSQTKYDSVKYGTYDTIVSLAKSASS